MACWTVVIFSASSSGISHSNSSSSAITSSTVSRESAPRSLTKDDSLLTSTSLTPSCSATIFLTRCSTFSIYFPFSSGCITRAGGILPNPDSAYLKAHQVQKYLAFARRLIHQHAAERFPLLALFTSNLKTSPLLSTGEGYGGEGRR